MQFLVLASELNATGFTIGSPITGISFPVVSLGAAWGTVIQSCQNFQLSIKSTTLNSLAQFQTGLVNVVPASNYTPVVGYGNTHVFSTPYVWDGQSNLVFETMFSNNIIGNGSTSVIQRHSNSGFQSTLVYRADNQNISTIAAATNSNLGVGLLRPNFILTGQPVGSYSWSASPFLSATSGTVTLASPTISSVFVATLSNGFCQSTNSVSIHVDTSPTLNITATSNSICIGNFATLTVNGANTYTWSSGVQSTSIVVSPIVASTYTVQGKNGVCASTSTTTTVTVLPALSLTVSSNPSVLCEGETSTLTALGASNYTWVSLTVGTSVTVSPLTNANYTVIGAVGAGCSASKTLSIKVNPLPEVLVSATADTICSGDQVNFFATGASAYTWQPGGTNGGQLTNNIVSTTVYTVTGRDLNLCSNSATISVVANICDGLAENTNENHLSVFPNPTSDHLTIYFGEEIEHEIRLYALDGKLLYYSKTSEISTRLNVREFANGLYLLEVSNRAGVQSKKITIQ